MAPTENSIPSWAQSSIDPTVISTTIESTGRAIAGVVVFFAVLKGVDPVIAGQTWGQLVALTATAAPAVYTTWHCGELIFGILRKVFVRLTGK